MIHGMMTKQDGWLSSICHIEVKHMPTCGTVAVPFRHDEKNHVPLVKRKLWAGSW
jgi:hypothetical protein